MRALAAIGCDGDGGGSGSGVMAVAQGPVWRVPVGVARSRGAISGGPQPALDNALALYEKNGKPVSRMGVGYWVN